MEPKQKPAHPATKEEDVDLGHLFYQTGGVINNFFNWLGRVFVALGNLILFFLFFVKRNVLWLLIGTIAGMIYGYILLSKTGSNYTSEMTVKTNFNSTRSLYGSTDFFNALINNRQTSELSRIFKLTPAEASSLRWFQVTPVVTEVITADLYKERFLNLYHNTQIRMDTFWVKTISYRDFKNSLTKYDYPLHEVSVTSTNAFIFPKIQKGIIDYISSIDMVKQVKASGDDMNNKELSLLESSIKSLDTLRNSYNKRLAAGEGTNEKGNNLTMLDGNVVVNPPELELYDKMLQLKDELKMVKSQAVMEKNILEIYSPFGTVGRKEKFLEQKMVRYALYGLLLAFIITALVGLYKTLTQIEKIQG